MSLWNDIRKQARQQHETIRAAASDGSAKSLIEAAKQLTEIPVYPVPAGDPLLDGGEAVFNGEHSVIYYNNEIDPRLALFFIAHEFAHYWQKHEHRACCTVNDIDPQASEITVPLGVQRIEGYSPKERIEREANVYAREFLLPSNRLRDLFINKGLTASEIANDLGLVEGMVLHQLALAVLTPELPVDGQEAMLPQPFTLDPSQQAAAKVEEGPNLIVAGPGTGKTQTLIGRVQHLISNGTIPSQILVLTFSNRAADDLRIRISQNEPDAALQLWAGTFHAFGLEMLRKFGDRLGLVDPLSVIDPVDAILLLEQHLTELQLHWYLDLREPTRPLRDILNAISRAKDEYIDPSQYKLLALKMKEMAQTEEDHEAADKALETAKVYSFYQSTLDDSSLLDFGDLITKTIDLLRNNQDIRTTVRDTYQHVLVDEYQDVNTAGALLLQEVAGNGHTLWAVGDVRQAIYRFRGAAPHNIHRFDQDFPGARIHHLKYNYRSRSAIIDTYSALAPHMRAGRGIASPQWQAVRDNAPGTVNMEIATDLDSEIAGIVRAINQQNIAGVSYRDQAILCRTHTQLARIATGLEQAGVPILYLGDLFIRPEIRDLLSLLALACEPDGVGLVRVGSFREYGVPREDILNLINHARTQQLPFPKALLAASSLDTLSAKGKAGFEQIKAQLEKHFYSDSAWSLLSHYLFNYSHYIRDLCHDNSIQGQQRRLAIYLFLQLVYEQRHRSSTGATDPKRVFLQYVRQLAMLGEDSQLRQVTEFAPQLDAIRMLTVHGSKGLEFETVYIPYLGQGYFPDSRKSKPCPPPLGMLAETEADTHDEEEECLLFVALSRARNTLYLSRACRYGKRNSNASRILSLIAHQLPHPPNGSITWASPPQVNSGKSDDPVKNRPLIEATTIEATAADLYIRCPQQYEYDYVLNLRRRRERRSFDQYRQCVYRVLHWLQEERIAGVIHDVITSNAHLQEIWKADGPHDHPYAAVYWEQAQRLITTAVTYLAPSDAELRRPALELELDHGLIRTTPDHILVREQNGKLEITVRRFRTGRKPKDENEDNIEALYQTAAERTYPGAIVQTENIYLSQDKSEIIRLNTKPLATRINRYEDALAGIARESFPANPNDHRCPRCPYFFICPLHSH